MWGVINVVKYPVTLTYLKNCNLNFCYIVLNKIFNLTLSQIYFRSQNVELIYLCNVK